MGMCVCIYIYIFTYVFIIASEEKFYARYPSDHNGNKTFSFFVSSLPFGYFFIELFLSRLYGHVQKTLWCCGHLQNLEKHIFGNSFYKS